MKLLTPFTLLPLALGAALDRRTCISQAQQFTDTYDKPPLLSGTVPAASPVGITAGGALVRATHEEVSNLLLIGAARQNYTGFVYVDARVGNTLLTAPSPPYVISTGKLAQQLQGGPQIEPVRGGPYNAFDLQSLFLICVANTETSATPAVLVACTIQVTGVRFDGTTAVTEVLFSPAPLPNLPTASRYTFKQFSSDFTGLRKVNVQLLQSSLLNDATVPVIDNTTYTTYNRKC